MSLKPGLAALAILLATPAMARDGALSLGLTAPPTALLAPGMSLGWQETLGRRLVLGVGLGVSEPRPDERDLGLAGRLSLPTDAGFNQRWYPWVGIEQPLPASRDAIDAAQWQAGLGLERFFLPEVAGYAELRWQPALTETVHIQIGLRFWPGRLNRLDARMRDSKPVQPERSAGTFSGPIVLETAPSPNATNASRSDPAEINTDAGAAMDAPDTPAQAQALVMQTAPVGDPVNISAVGEVDVSESSPTPQSNGGASVASVDSLAAGTYVHLGLFRAEASIQRLQRQLDPGVRSQTRVAFDAQAGGYRVVLGPYREAQAIALRTRLAEQDIDSFLYRRD